MQQLDISNISQFSKKISFYSKEIMQTFFHDRISNTFFEIM